MGGRIVEKGGRGTERGNVTNHCPEEGLRGAATNLLTIPS